MLRLDLDDVPLVLADRIQDVHAGEPAVVHKARLEQRLPRLGGLQRLLEHLLEVGHVGADLDAAGVEGFGQSADFVALIEDRLRGGVRLRNLILGVVGVPEQLPALAAPEELRLRDVGPLRRGGGGQNGAGHDGLCDAGCAEIEQEGAPEPVTGGQAHMATPQFAYPYSPKSGKELAKEPLLPLINLHKCRIINGASGRT